MGTSARDHDSVGKMSHREPAPWVRYVDMQTVDSAALHRARAVLSENERQRCDRLATDRHRHEYAIAHALLRTTLSERGELPPGAWRFQTSDHGKPVLAPGQSSMPLAFSLTHTRGLVACIVAVDMIVGIDAEQVDASRAWRAIAERRFCHNERSEIDALSEAHRVRRFTEFWTLKEAFSKAVGLGLSQPFNDVCFDLRTDGAIICALPASDGPEATAWQVATYAPTPEHVMSIVMGCQETAPWTVSVTAVSAPEPLTPERRGSR